jgi:transglutaminase-like putative cysteine protease
MVVSLWRYILPKLGIYHETTYKYLAPIQLGPHRLMLRPRESRNLRLVAHDLKLTPTATVTWAHDVFGNAVATATFQGLSDTLIIESTVELSLDEEQWPVFDIAASAVNFPFLLTEDEVLDLGALRLQAYLDSYGRLREWAQGFVTANPTDTLCLLRDLCGGVAAQVAYEIRESEGTQTPTQTLNLNQGSCRDFAVLFIDAVRSLGFGARIVSGYLYDPDHNALGTSGSGSTHAWAEVYVPGAGWITFDPTNRSIGRFNLIPVAVARHIRQTIPISGSFAGDPDALEEMSVRVRVAPLESVQREQI